MSIVEKQATEQPKGNKKIQFCSYCGARLDEDAKFCKDCGERVNRDSGESKEGEPSNKSAAERKMVYDGAIHKCPNCGEVLESFTSNCPSCGYEIRDVRSSTSVRKLALKIDKISAQEMQIDDDRSIMEKIFGRDFKDENDEKEAREAFEKEKTQRIANTILNFPVPNTKEDFYEFMILASSNIDADNVDDIITEAWISKFKQVYKKAMFAMDDDPDFEEIQEIYDNKMCEVNAVQDRISKKKKFKIIAGVSFIAIGIIMIIFENIAPSLEINTSYFGYAIGMWGMIIGAIIMMSANNKK